MIALQRTSRDGAWIILPFLVFFGAVLAFALYLEQFKPSPKGDSLLLYTTLLVFGCFIAWYVFRLVYPSHYVTYVLEDRIVLHNSRHPDDDTVLMRSDIRQFFTERPVWNSDERADLRVIAERFDGTCQPIDYCFVTESSAAQLYDIVQKQWGTEFVATHTHSPEDAADIQAMRRIYARRPTPKPPSK